MTKIKRLIIMLSALFVLSSSSFATTASTMHEIPVQTPPATVTTTPTPMPTKPIPAVVEPTPLKIPVFTSTQKAAIEKIVHDYLLTNPEILLQASIKLRQKMQQQQQQQSMQAIEANKVALFDDPNSPIAGNPTGSKVLVEFFDYQCPHCKTMVGPLQTLIKANPDLKIVFKDWPIFGGASELAAKAAIAANKQDKYLALHNALLNAANPLTETKIMQLAKTVGLNTVLLKKDMDDPATEALIKANFELAQQLKLEGTPAFVLTNKNENTYKFIPGETSGENLQKLLNELGNQAQ